MYKILMTIAFGFAMNFAMAQKQITKHHAILSGHSNDLNAVSYSQRLNLIASAGWDNSINFYKNDSTFRLLKTLKDAHRAQINVLKYNKVGNLLASASNDFVIQVFDSTFKKNKMLIATDGHTANINAITFDNTSKVLFSGDDAGKIIIWNLELQKKIKLFNHGVAINAVAMGNDPRMLIVAGAEPTIKVLNLGSGKIQSTFSGHTDVVNAIEISPNQKYLLSGSNDKSARIWDMKTGKEVRKLPVDCWKVTAVAFSNDGKYCATGCNDGSMKIWEVETGKLIESIVAQSFNARSLVFVRNNQYLAVAPLLKSGNDYGLRIYETNIVDSVLLMKTLKIREKFVQDSTRASQNLMRLDSIKNAKLNAKMIADSLRKNNLPLKKDSLSLKVKKVSPTQNPKQMPNKTDTIRIFKVPSY